MVYITGDLHGEFERFKSDKIKRLKKDDFLIVCGDFGFIWDNSKKELRSRKKIGKCRFYTLFVEGINENRSLLETFPEEDFMGGKAVKIEGNIYMLKKGEVYDLCGKKFLAIGGGDEMDYIIESDSVSSPLSDDEKENTLNNLKAHGNSIDYIITHDAPNSVKQFMDIGEYSFGHVCEFLDKIFESAEFTRWFFGKYHIDKQISYRLCAVYSKIYPLHDTLVVKNKKKNKKPDLV